ncbi:hypothetical protein Ae201684_010041 [Aphanomyces euteiches]|uniref:Helicase ATP-binding domain-containing protein n=1 Tax=Aphanomyces euteiches TaxID=100861 RepID=A0A6G0WZE2_9STRA|nr:hypothetical protein Ae201684_010041 [Aphanomyces euteiches]KAH9145614.1 hypothetical protein AeRB84_010479 [Aphanomyces euteiches]
MEMARDASADQVAQVQLIPNESAKRDVKDEEEMTHTEDMVFSPYVCQSINIGKPHPGTISEAALLSTAPLPPCTYPHEALPNEVIEQGKLTNLQLEGVLYACMQHQKILPNGERCGFFLGDGTGVGKGRQLAGIIFENLCRGRKKHLWFSVSNDLRVDAERDLSDIGCHVNVIDGCQQLEKEKSKGFGISSKTGVLYSTYSTLTSNFSHATKSRLAQIVDWCGPGFDGCILFDECHKAKHGELSDKNATASKIAQAVQKIQALLPMARVVYCSATGVGGIEHMAYMTRLGLWGPTTAFQGFSEFLRTIKNRGMGAMEMLAIEMKLQGKYVSRGLSYVGAEFELQTVALTDHQRQIYENAVGFWNILFPALDRACAITRTQGEVMRTMWGSHQRFFRQLCMCMKVPFIISTVKDSLASGHCVVIGLQTTGEASMERSNIADGKATSLISLCERILIDFISLHFPTKIKFDQNTSHNTSAIGSIATTNSFLLTNYNSADETTGPCVTLPDGSKESLVCVELKTALLAKIQQLELPPNPLDHLIDELGGESHVAELTGRRQRIVNSNGVYKMKSRGLNLDQVNQEERKAFMKGQKLIAIISDAASTGISLHADKRCANQRRRVHITLELPWSADKAIQQLGRSHRSNQSCAPIYKLVTTNCGGETRFVAAVAKKMMTMGALTKGDRRAGSGQDLSGYHFETKYGFQAVREVLRCVCNDIYADGVDISAMVASNPCLQSPLHMNSILAQCLKDIGLFSPNQSTVSVKLFLNRLLGLAPLHQNALFYYFEKTLQVIIGKAQQEGKYDEGYDDIKGRKATLVQEKDVGSNVTYSHVSVDRGISWEEASSIHQNISNDLKAEFYVSDQKYFGEYLYMLMITGGRACSIIRPNTGYLSIEPTKIDDMRDKYSVIKPQAAERGWKRIFNHCETKCIHTSGCKQGETCKVGLRKLQYHLLSGSLLPIWKLLEQLITGQNDPFSNSALRIVRITLTNSTKQKLVGVNFPEDMVPMLQAALITMAANTKIQVEPVAPIDVQGKARLGQAKRTILNFFAPQGKQSEPKRHRSEVDLTSSDITNKTKAREGCEEILAPIKVSQFKCCDCIFYTQELVNISDTKCTTK